MNRINIYRNTNKEQTTLSNLFIDEYMADANDAQLKIYLFLIRMMGANLATSVYDIAEKFNYTEKDVLRALMYWESRQLLSLEYDATGNLSGIQVLSLDSPMTNRGNYESVSRITPVLSFIRPASDFRPASDYRPVQTSAPVVNTASVATEKPKYTTEDLKNFKTDEEASQLLYVIEQYLGKQLIRTDLETLYFIYDTLGFSVELIEYLVEHCVENKKKDIRYIEKVAIAWAEQGITTPDQAKLLSKGYNKEVYAVMKFLGKNTNPAPKEIQYINKWTNDYHFPLDVIEEACNRTVIATDTNRFAYADGIMNKWFKSGVSCMADIAIMDANYRETSSVKRTIAKPVTAGINKNNRFNQFTQNEYDFDMLEQSIISN